MIGPACIFAGNFPYTPGNLAGHLRNIIVILRNFREYL
jgi:hypothetical protein